VCLRRCRLVLSLITRLGQSHIYIGYFAYTVFLAGKLRNIWPYTVYIYGSGQSYLSPVQWNPQINMDGAAQGPGQYAHQKCCSLALPLNLCHHATPHNSQAWWHLCSRSQPLFSKRGAVILHLIRASSSSYSNCAV